MAGQGKKTFVAGEVLLAQDVNDYLMDQSVMNFATVAARSSAIPTPTTGMVSYVGDTGTDASTIPQVETYTGAAWQTPYGLTLIANASFSGASFTVTNVFSATYDNYLLVISNMSGTAPADLVFRVGTADTLYYSSAWSASPSYATASGNVTFTNAANSSGFNTGIIVSNTAGERGGGQINLHNPFIGVTTTFSAQGTDPRSTGAARFNSGVHLSATSFTGFTFFMSGGTFNAGTVRVYGYRNS
jgi:hypothetical protein